MIGIYAPTEKHSEIAAAIHAQHERLHELVTLHPLDADNLPIPDGQCICITNNQIWLPPDWWQSGPPVVFPALSYHPQVLIGWIYTLLHNFDAAAQFFQTEPEAWYAISTYALLLQERTQQTLPESIAENYTARHNYAVGLHYTHTGESGAAAAIQHAYETALAKAQQPAQLAFTTVQLAALLTDAGKPQQAASIVQAALPLSLHDTHATNQLKWMLCTAWLQMISVPYDEALLSRLKETLWEVLTYFETWNRVTEQGLLLTEAAHIANISESFAEGLGYINKAIALLEKEGLPELAANAQLKKGILLYTWAQKGQPQFYKGAKDALLRALQVFNRDAAPHVFAEIHHYLGIIYSEIPDEVQKKSVWAGVSVASFQEALNFYNKVDYPYEFAQICHHFGNAFTKYPTAALGDNYEKALNWYTEALSVRTAAAYPLERSLTLSNYLDAAWNAGNPGDGYSEARWQDMWDRAQELKALAADEALRSEAQQWLNALVQAKAV